MARFSRMEIFSAGSDDVLLHCLARRVAGFSNLGQLLQQFLLPVDDIQRLVGKPEIVKLLFELSDQLQLLRANHLRFASASFCAMPPLSPLSRERDLLRHLNADVADRFRAKSRAGVRPAGADPAHGDAWIGQGALLRRASQRASYRFCAACRSRFDRSNSCRKSSSRKLSPVCGRSAGIGRPDSCRRAGLAGEALSGIAVIHNTSREITRSLADNRRSCGEVCRRCSKCLPSSGPPGVRKCHRALHKSNSKANGDNVRIAGA